MRDDTSDETACVVMVKPTESWPSGTWTAAGTETSSSELASSKSDARRLLQQGSVRANDRRVGPDDGLADVPLLHGRYLLLRKGKRSFHLVEVSENPG